MWSGRSWSVPGILRPSNEQVSFCEIAAAHAIEPCTIRRGTIMGRHAAPESDSATEVMVIPELAGFLPGAPTAALREAWADVTHRKAMLGAVAAVGAVVVGFGVLASAGSSLSNSESTTTPAESARSQGVSYAAELRDEGYNSMTVMGRCEINDGGYGGSFWDDYSEGCVGVALQMMDHGR